MNNVFDIDSDFKRSLIQAENIFIQNGIFIYPTDTIYGIGGNPFDKKVKGRINQLKKRDKSKNFIFLIGSIKLIEEFVITDPISLNKIDKVWPASVSVILKLKPKYALQLKQNTVAFRIPSNKFCLELLNRINSPIISTSVNEEGKNPLNDYEEIIMQFSDKVDAVFYSKKKHSVLSSTIIDLTGNEPKLIRQGATNFMDLLNKIS